MRRGPYYYPRRKSGAKWILLLIVIGVVIWYANSKGIINLNLPNFGNFSFSGVQNLISVCEQKVNACGTIINSKFGANVSILEKLQVQNSNEANQFLLTWKNPSQDGEISNYNVSSYPIVLVATRFDYASGNKIPYAFVCKPDGNLDEKSTAELC